MLLTRVKVWRCTKIASRVSLRFFVRDAEVVPKTSISQVISNAELGLMCTDEKDNEELTNMYGPLCWQVYDKDPGGFTKKRCGTEL